MVLKRLNKLEEVSDFFLGKELNQMDIVMMIGWFPLHYSAFYDNKEIVEARAEHGARRVKP